MGVIWSCVIVGMSLSSWVVINGSCSVALPALCHLLHTTSFRPCLCSALQSCIHRGPQQTKGKQKSVTAKCSIPESRTSSACPERSTVVVCTQRCSWQAGPYCTKVLGNTCVNSTVWQFSLAGHIV